MIKWLLLLLVSGHIYVATPRHIVFDPGGELYQRYMDWRQVQISGQKVVLDGICLSGCVIFTGVVAPEKVCITKKAIVGVHSATDAEGKFVLVGTHLYWQMLSPEIRAMVIEGGWRGNTEHPDFIYIAYNSLSKLYRECDEATLAEVYKTP